MFDLEQAIADWRKNVAVETRLEPQMLDELENHLRETVHQSIDAGVAEPLAFERAVAQLGTPQALATEFEKLERPAWLPAKIAKGFLIALIGIALLALLTAPRRHQVTPLGVVLAFHVCTVTFGYFAALLVGALGICFVCQQAFTEISSRRLDSIRETSFRFARLALYFSAGGTGLGMIWAKGCLGPILGLGQQGNRRRLCVLIWLGGYLAAHRSGRIFSRAASSSRKHPHQARSSAWPGLAQALLPGLHAYG